MKGDTVIYPLTSSTILLSLLLPGLALPARAEDCGAAKPGDKCQCRLADLKPLQGAIGLGEVKKKLDKIKKHPKDEMQELTDDPIKIVRGLGGQLYVTDHHHGARAWIDAGQSAAVCQLQCDLSSLPSQKFWSTLQEDRLVHLEDRDGKAIKTDELPSSIAQLKDDPYRSLAYYARKDKWICRSLMGQTEFAEFLWADWFRKQPKLSGVKASASPEQFVDKAHELAERASDRPPGFLVHGESCPKEQNKIPKCAVR